MLRSALGALFWLGLFASARAQPALDAVTHSNTSNGGSTVTVSVTTSAANEIVLVAMADRISDASAAISGCTLTWHAGGLANGGKGFQPRRFFGGHRPQRKYCHTPCTVTITPASTCFFNNGCATLSWAISGANLTSPVDPNVGLPYQAVQTSHSESPNCSGGSSSTWPREYDDKAHDRFPRDAME